MIQFPKSQIDFDYSNQLLVKSSESLGIIDTIGNTPLIPIRKMLSKKTTVKIYAKAEWFNPGGSIKDRAAWSMIKEGIISGKLTSEKTLIDATSGNTGIAYAMISNALGINVKLCIPRNASPERLKLLQAYGAELVLTDPLDGMDCAIETAQKIVQENPEQYFYPDQYNNKANWLAHYDGTGLEIWQQTNGEITHFVSGLGTSGTFMGTSYRLKKENSAIKVISVQPDNPFHGIEGLKHMESSLVPGIYDSTLADENVIVSTHEAQELTKELAKKEGILVGISSGASLAVCLKIAQNIDSGTIVTVFPDRGDRYLSENFWR